MKLNKLNNKGFSVAELAIAIVVFGIVAISVIGLFSSLVKSAVITKRKAVATTLATNQMEYLKSLPYDSLAIAGGSIVSASPLPANVTHTIDNVKYTVTSSISFVDDAFDGCFNYPSQEDKEFYCRNYPPPSGAPTTDSNERDYKIAHVSVSANGILASVDTQISARVAETASTTGAMFVTVLDDSGNPVSGANVNLTNSTLTPAINLNDSTDIRGRAIFYGLPPDTSGFDYVVTASRSGYSTLATIAPNGTLQPNFRSQNILAQQSSSVTLYIMPQSSNSFVLEATNTSGSPLQNMRVYVKGGYKKYIETSDTSYYYDNMTPPDARPTTDADGLATISNLAPGPYIFCGDTGTTNCGIGGTTYYLAAAIPYTSSNAFNPVRVPPSTPAPAITYPFGGQNYMQKVRLILTTDSTFPRVYNIDPDTASLSSDINNVSFTIHGQNLPCSSNPASCATDVQIVQGSNTYTATCTGGSGMEVDCGVNLSGISAGNSRLVITVGSKVLSLPATPVYGGLIIEP